MSRREALEVTRGDEARPIQPRRFSIVLRKPLAARNDGGAPKSAFKTPKLPGAAARGRVSFAGGPAGARRVSFLARDVDAADAASAPADPRRPPRRRSLASTAPAPAPT